MVDDVLNGTRNNKDDDDDDDDDDKWLQNISQQDAS